MMHGHLPRSGTPDPAAPTALADRPGFSRKMTAEEINALPMRRYEGPVRLVRSAEELAQAIPALKHETVLGFDTETRPTFVRGQNHPPALVQLAARDAVFVFQLSHLGFPAALRGILADGRIIKAGVALDRDIAELKTLAPFDEAGMVDLGSVAKQAGIKNHGLRGLAAVLLGFRISKQARRSNWAVHTLSPAQIRYAATDAWVGRELYLHLKQGGYM